MNARPVDALLAYMCSAQLTSILTLKCLAAIDNKAKPQLSSFAMPGTDISSSGAAQARGTPCSGVDMSNRCSVVHAGRASQQELKEAIHNAEFLQLPLQLGVPLDPHKVADGWDGLQQQRRRHSRPGDGPKALPGSCMTSYAVTDANICRVQIAWQEQTLQH